MKKAECQELFLVNKKDAPEIIKVKGVRGYVDEQNVAWLNVEDVARGLGFVQVKNGVEYPRYDRISAWLAEYGFPHRVGKEDYIPENMFYRLAMKANNEAAKEFQAKVADEILPNIRKHGFYATPTKIEEIVRDPDRFIEELYNGYKRVKSERDAALAQVAELKPKADYTEKVLQSDEKLTSELIAKEYGHTGAWLHQILKSIGKMYPRGQKWYLKAPYDKYNYRVSETVLLGHGKTAVNQYWTQAGRYFIYNTLAEIGYHPLRESESSMATLL